jgi:hypothetical protein
LRNHYQEATDIYKRLLLENREFIALNVYVALCYYKLDYYDVSLEILQVYLQQHSDSVVAINLKACNHFRLYNGKAGEAELKTLADKQGVAITQYDNDLIRHNLCVFRNGENALQILPPLVDAIPEARLNLVIYHLRCEEFKEAHNLMKDIEPSSPEEYILKGVVNACIGQVLLCNMRSKHVLRQGIASLAVVCLVRACCGGCDRRLGADGGQPGDAQDCGTVLPAGGGVCQPLRHHPGASVHGDVLLPPQAVR